MLPPLIEQLVTRHGCTYLQEDKLDWLLETDLPVALFFTEDPKRYPEANDVAVVLPELVKACGDCFRIAVVDRDLEAQLKNRYDITLWPSLVFLREGEYLGKINKMRDWSEYMALIPEILQREPTRNPGVGIPVVEE